MSRATKRKHVLLEVLQNDYTLPTEDQQIVRLLNSRGNNLHEVEDPEGATFLVSMPTKFRKNVWVKRGDYVLIESIKEGDKVKGEIVRILTHAQVKYFEKENVWPAGFTEQDMEENSSSESSDDSASNETSSESSDSSEDDGDNKLTYPQK